MQNSVSKNLSKSIHLIFQRRHRQLAAKKLVRSKKKSRPKAQKWNSQIVFKKNCETTKKSPFVAKKIIAHKNNFPLSLVFFLEMEQFVLVPFSVYNSSNNPTIVTKQELPKYKPEQTPTYHKDTLKKEFNQQFSTSASSLVSKILQTPSTKLSNSNTLILDGIDNGELLKDFAERLKRENVTIPDIYFTLLDEVSITPDIVVNSHA